MGAYAFLFGIPELEKVARGSYGHPAYRWFFAAVLDADASGEEAFHFYHGDLLLQNLAYRVSKVSFEGKRVGPALAGVGRTESGDPELFQTLIWDFCDGMKERWNSVDQDDLPSRLGRWEVYAVAASNLTASTAAHVDSELRQQRAYVGAFEVDVGNPIQQRVSVGGLINDRDYLARELIFDPWDTDNPFDPPPLMRHGDEWFTDLPFSAVRYPAEGEDLSDIPQWPTAALSERGVLSAAILAQRRGKTHLDRLAGELATIRVEDGVPPFEVSVEAMPRAADAIVVEEKLTQYALNPDHEVGKHKAKLFKELLGIELDDWRYLAAQLKDGLADATTIAMVRSEEHGVKYHVVIPITGRNGRVVPVVSAWIVDHGGPPRLTTVFVAERGIELPADSSPPRPRALPASLSGEEKWTALWELADSSASAEARATVPTPMRVSGDWYPDGRIGFAWVNVRDARTGFARWLIKNEKAKLGYRGGADVFAPGSSYDRASAYVDAFADVLKLNGIEFSITKRLD